MHVLPGPHELPLRGRAEEIARVRELLEAARVPGSALLTFEGPPGIGKSRVLREAGRVAEASGYAVVNGLPPMPLPTDRPLAVLLDDLHCAGAEEARALSRLRGELIDSTVVWFTARRTGWAHRSVDEVLTGMAGYQERWLLGPLPGPALDDLVHEFLGRRPGPLLRHALSETGGHPQLARALMEGLVEEGRVRAGSTTDLVDGPVPARVSALVRSRTRGCSETCRRMVSVAAVLGRRIVFGELAHTLGVAPSDLLTATEEATAAGLMSTDGQDLAFASELLWRVIHESVPPTVRSALRQQAEPHGSLHVGPAGAAGRPESKRIPPTRHVLRAAHRHAHPPRRMPAAGMRSPTASVRADRSLAVVSGAEPSAASTAAPPQALRAAPGAVDGGASVATARVSPARAQAWDALNERQRAIVRLVIRGLTNRQIADEVHLSPHTVNYHLRRIYQEFGIGSRLGLIGIAHTHGLP